MPSTFTNILFNIVYVNKIQGNKILKRFGSYNAKDVENADLFFIHDNHLKK